MCILKQQRKGRIVRQRGCGYVSVEIQWERERVCVRIERKKKREGGETKCVCVRENGLTDEVLNAGLVITKDDKVSDHQLLH
jgi:hypothetical protein